MWITIVASLVVLISRSFCSGSIVHDGINAYQNFKDTYKQNSSQNSTSEENLKSLLRFVNTFQIIKSHNDLYESGETSFEMGINKFADLSLGDIDKFSTGNLPVPDIFPNLLIPRSDLEILKISERNFEEHNFRPGPESVDWRTLGHVTPVKDQGYFCNSCWAFSTTATLESAFSIKYGRSMNLSEQYLIDCNRNFQYGNWGCDGGNPITAFANIRYSGIPKEDFYQYSELKPHSDLYPCSYDKSTSVGNIRGYAILETSNETIIRDIVANVGPVAVQMNSGLKSFISYKSGVYDDPECVPGTSHSIALVGYGKARYKSGKVLDYWLCKNSWSNEWGDKGYFRIIRGQNLCGIEESISFPLV